MYSIQSAILFDIFHISYSLQMSLVDLAGAADTRPVLQLQIISFKQTIFGEKSSVGGCGPILCETLDLSLAQRKGFAVRRI